MLRHISVKLSILFSIILLVIISVILVITHSYFTNFFVKYVTDELLHRGNGHAEVLADQFDATTLSHVAHMEKAAITDVVVVGRDGHILVASDQINCGTMEEICRPMEAILVYEQAIETDWRNQPYVVTSSPVIRDNHVLAMVYMYTPTQPIRDAVAIQFKILFTVWVGSILIGISFIYFLSKLITRPVLEMKNATELISNGRYDVQIKSTGNDELSDLGNTINALAQNLQHYETSRHEFLSDISHELRTPLTYLKGYSELLANGDVTDPKEVQQYSQIIYDESKRLQRLVQDIMTLSKMDETQFTLMKKPTDLVALIKDTINTILPLFQDKQIKLNFIYDKDKMELPLDKERMAQVVLNLLDNARRYTPESGEVTVELTHTNQLTKIAVKDNGPGIPEQELPLIWQRLYRAEKSRSRDTGGSGLGLAIVKKIIELHGGEIYAYSELGKGTIFEIYLQNHGG
ncbi:sensor histidine kinase [Desulfuribacillus alkaliarsenatis]|uniref:histidine kinase n=1 Tax=Desulfuribacillus alkaliarsenatis TaxID=766136 RepID=A0A1E5G4R9_9FIRM|nr:HAMP domain-containing sensor histidine kinase [Desulfuribacillus alkaliarsenatis]OEF98182.1 hypothetical protein BHF68_00380 [Desulfuribacillus alkaliarsenatis]